MIQVAAPAPEVVAGTPPDEVFVFPTSYAQQRLWLLHGMEPESPLYNCHRTFRLTGALRVHLVREALQVVVDRHEALRTTFAVQDGEPVQVISPHRRAALGVVDLGRLRGDASEREVGRLSAHAAARGFDLCAGPLARFALLRVDGEDHVFLYTLHHIVTDGWSMRVFSREVTRAYRHLSQGRLPDLPELPVQYADYAEWQRGFLAGGVSERQLAWWKHRLQGAPPVLELPTDRPRPAVRRFRGGDVQARLPEASASALRALAQSQGATTFMAALAGLNALLARYCGHSDVVVGTPVAGRSHRELEGVIGFFVNTLALRSDVSGDPTFRELLARTREEVLEAQANQDVPFDRIVEELKPPRTLSHSPVFQVMFTYESARPGVGPSDVSAQALLTGVSSAKFDLTVGVGDAGGEIWISFAYDRDLFDVGTVRRMAAHYAALLEQAAAQPDRRVSDLDLLGEAGRREVVEAWNETAAPFPRDRTVHALFAETAAQFPDAPAVEYGGSALSYADLDARANRLANVLRGRGVGPDVRVGVCLERGTDLVVATLAVLKAGGTYLPLDPRHPSERLAYLLEDSRARLVVARGGAPGALAAGAVPVLCLTAAADELAGAPAAAPACAAASDHLAYVIYTSGSTGRPKGVAVPHRAVVRLVRGTNYVALAPGDRVGQVSTPAFDAATFEIWGALLNGAVVQGVSRDVALDPRAFAEEIRASGITTLFLTTALFNLVAREVASAFAPVREVLFGGEAADPECVRRVVRAGGPRRLLHVYGPTETTTFATWHPVQEVPPPAATIPIGAGLSNTTLYVLDANRRPVPVGVPGELYVGGDGLARGYLERPALTAERFVPHPFSAAPGGRLYRTGDRVRWIPGGAVEFLGRLDDQVKIRGFRIEPREVQAVLESQPSVSAAAVIVREDTPGDRRLVAYVVPAEQTQADGAALRAHLAAVLPDFMVPAAVVSVERLPLNANGKLDRGALPAPPAARAAGAAAARTPAEALLAGVWTEVLGVEGAGADDDFFALGGHSLLAARVAARVRQVFGAEVPLRTFFEHPTLAALARALEAARGRAQALPPILPACDGGGEAPLSFEQERLWFVQQVSPGSTAYNVYRAHRVSGSLHRGALARALAGVVCRHEVLRTCFPVVDGRPVQRVSPVSGDLPVPLVDLSRLDAAARGRAVRRCTAREAARPFDLTAGPLVRAMMLRTGAREHVLSLCLHHAVSDGWSMEVLHREIAVLYDSFRRGEPSTLPPLPVQYADYARWQRRHLAGERLEALTAFWRQRLADAPPQTGLVPDEPRPAVRRGRGATRSLLLPAELSADLRALARREGATMFMVVLAAFQALLSRWGDDEDVVVGTPVAGRPHAELEALVGFFVNTLVLRTDHSGDPSFRELLGRVREGVLDAHAHQALPFEKLVEAVQPERSLNHTPLFQVMFTFEAAKPAPAEQGGGAALQDVAPAVTTAKFDLTASAGEADGRVWMAVTYDVDLFHAATVDRMLRHWHVLLNHATADAGSPLSFADLVDPGERRRLLGDWNATGAGVPSDTPVHVLFERQARRSPRAVAVAWGDERLTYEELDARANRLAHHLRRRGVEPDVRVGLWAERSPEMVVAILGILKAGGAYLPLDPASPPDRLAYMIEDAGARLVVVPRGLAPELPGEALCLDAAAAAVAREPGHAPAVEVSPDHLLYVIYTSGSTGRPKGTEVPHRSIPGFFWEAAYARFGPDEVFLQHSSPSWDGATLELWAPLLHGGCCVLYPGPAVEAARLGEVIRRHGVNTLWLTAGFFNLVAESFPEALADVRQVIAGGDVLSPPHVRRVQAAHPHVRLVNGYGPSECTVFACCHPVPPGFGGAAVPIGRPVGDRRVYVVDRRLRLVPVGVSGELLVGGPAVPRGYLGRRALTAEKLIPDAFGGDPGARLYRTGDRVRWRADGTLEFLGRLDGQVKIRGFRVEPGEVEAALLEHTSVGECAVVARDDAPGGKALVAYVVAPSGAPPPEALRAHLHGRVPDYMLPAAFVELAALPLGPSGKVDRRALPAPAAGDRARTVYAPPRDSLEGYLVRVWEDLLQTAPVGIHDDFFHLGGHSLLAAELMWRLAWLGREETWSVATLFTAPTVAQLAGVLRAGGGGGISPLVRIQPRGAGDPLFLVHPAGGNVLCYGALSHHLGPDQPLYGLQARGLDGREQVHDSVAAMAEDYLREVRAERPHGPYLLGGWSMGGVVALEMARRLRAAGESVPVLALLDSAPPSGLPPDDDAEEVEILGDVLHGLGVDVQALERRFPRASVLDVPPASRLRRLLEAAGAAHLLEAERFARVDRLYEVYRANCRALRMHRPEPYPGKVLLFRAGERASASRADPTLGWGAIAPAVEAHIVPGNHLTMLEEPNVATLAATLATTLRQKVADPCG